MQYRRGQSYGTKNAIKKKLATVMETVDFARYHPATGLRQAAYAASVDFLRTNGRYAVAFSSPKDLLEFALKKARPELGLFAEFGVYAGASINYIADEIKPHRVYGFDSFEGLPVDWHNMPKDFFSLGGKLPKVRRNVTLVRGFFDQSLPEFFRGHSENLCFAHIDCDVYVSTQSVLANIADRVVPGTLLLFDDYFNQPFWEDDSHKAFEEVRQKRGWNVEYVGYSYQEMLVRIT